MKKKIALITGITGQDGSYLAELLLKKKYNVHGYKKIISFNTSRIDHLYQDPHLKNRNLFSTLWRYDRFTFFTKINK